MSNIGCRRCRFCRQTFDGEFDIRGEVMKQKLDALLLKLNLDTTKEAVICKICATKLQTAGEAKFLPINTHEENILNDIAIVEFIKSPKLCRFCMKMTKTGCHIHLQEKKENMFIVDMVQEHIPKLSLTTTDEIISCESCLSSIQNLLSFIAVCWEVKGKVERNIDKTAVKCQLKLNDDIDFMLKNDGCLNVDVSKIEKIKEEKDVNIPMKLETPNEDQTEIQYPELNIKDEVESFQDASTPSEETVYKCQNCIFMTRNKRYLKTHMMIHRELSEGTVYTCEKCFYVAKQKDYLKRHMLKHRKLSKIPEYTGEKCSYTCEKCSYTASQKRYLKMHMLNHLDPSEKTVYKCESCSYVAKYKHYLKSHIMLIHRPSEITGFECASCSYKGNTKKNLKRHMLIHRKLSEIQVYKCKSCLYTTKHKSHLKRHMLTHPEFSEVEAKIYRCEYCSFVTKRKDSLNFHVISHQELSKVYSCERCLFVTKRVEYLTRHMRSHRETFQEKEYACNNCSFVSKYKRSLIRHLRIHRNPLDATI